METIVIAHIAKSFAINKHVSVIFLVVLLIGCGSQHQTSVEDIVSPVLLREIDVFVQGRQTDDSLKIILVDINDSLLYICPSVFYNYHESTGHFFYQGKLVGFHLGHYAGKWNFVDTAKLEKGRVKGYPEEFPVSVESDSLEYKYDFRVRTYQIHSKDSLELIFWGYY